MFRFTYQLLYCPLFTKILVYSLFLQVDHSSQESQSVPQVSKLVATAACTVKTVSMTKEGICAEIVIISFSQET